MAKNGDKKNLLSDEENNSSEEVMPFVKEEGESDILVEEERLREEAFGIEKKVEELEDLIKRQAADFDNYRKRMQEEKDKVKESAQEGVILDFLSVFDNLERAFESCRAPGADIESVKEGLEGIMALFMDFLSRFNIQRVDSIGKPFDPKKHEALFMQEGDYKERQIIQEVEKAYIRKDKVLRTAKVGVGVPFTKQNDK